MVQQILVVVVCIMLAYALYVTSLDLMDTVFNGYDAESIIAKFLTFIITYCVAAMFLHKI